MVFHRAVGARYGPGVSFSGIKRRQACRFTYSAQRDGHTAPAELESRARGDQNLPRLWFSVYGAASDSGGATWEKFNLGVRGRVAVIS